MILDTILQVVNTTVTTTTSTTVEPPSIYPIPDSTLIVTLTSIALGLLTQLVTRFMVDLKAEQRMKKEVGDFNKEKRALTLELTKLKKDGQGTTDKAKQTEAKLDKLSKKEIQVRQAQAKLSMGRLKVTAITFVPLIAVYYIMAGVLGGFGVIVAHSPVPVPLLVNPDGTVSLFWWYLLSSFAFSSLMSRALHTTT